MPLPALISRGVFLINKVEVNKLDRLNVNGVDVNAKGIDNYDFSSNCHGLALADGEFVVLDPETILQDEYTVVDRSQGDDSSSKKSHDVVGVDQMG